ncbi:hypothetical protein THAOC_36450 [Thalassiosira oceanica]|uniref:Uncharacterized protein n=1 Tax=Thalassiosira oceanica TaxID=159749 RepID=K0R062_THAOC|nr:hypothetical protein THAOC_36450 [Thalassiosira oceanica]|eukprot:EJK44970.1 hypothetical protein THAOC_36450 [Thalassiosira oceanica]
MLPIAKLSSARLARIDTRQARRRGPFETSQACRRRRCPPSSASVAVGSSSLRDWNSYSTGPGTRSRAAGSFPTPSARFPMTAACGRGGAATPRRPSSPRDGCRLADQGPTAPICFEPCRNDDDDDDEKSDIHSDCAQRRSLALRHVVRGDLEAVIGISLLSWKAVRSKKTWPSRQHNFGPKFLASLLSTRLCHGLSCHVVARA